MQREASIPLFIRNSKCRLSCKVVYNSNWLFLQLSFLSHWLRFQHIHFEQTDTILGAPSLSVQALPEHGARLTPETLSQCQCRSPSPNIPWLLLPAQGSSNSSAWCSGSSTVWLQETPLTLSHHFLLQLTQSPQRPQLSYLCSLVPLI